MKPVHSQVWDQIDEQAMEDLYSRSNADILNHITLNITVPIREQIYEEMWAKLWLNLY